MLARNNTAWMWASLLAVCAVVIVGLATLRAAGGATAATPLYAPHPDDPSKQVEYFLDAPAGAGPWPTVVLLHGHQAPLRPGGRVFVDWGVLKGLAERGYLAVAVSQPGYGDSSGPADFCGPWTQHAVSGVIAKLRADGLASPTRLLIEGISRGAMTAGLIAGRDPSVSGLVLISGIYDLPSYAAAAPRRGIQRDIVDNLTAETGGGPEALEARSVLRLADQIKAEVLILAGAEDERTDPDQARTLAEQIERAGGHAQAIVFPDAGHQIPVDERNVTIDPFMDRVLGGP
ncbi:MAG: prolyl oligopeptidase family serine peptidase [Alphaproteobacteria bacterium]|nr:prolyl oligopeptidase family serine peptidase [Alphaproteobacteria bacterium]